MLTSLYLMKHGSSEDEPEHDHHGLSLTGPHGFISIVSAFQHNYTLARAVKYCDVNQARPGSVVAYSTVLFNRTELDWRRMDYRKSSFKKTLTFLINAYPSYTRYWYYFGKVKSLDCEATSLTTAGLEQLAKLSNKIFA
ncbi:hypothetical protein FBUS_01576 [Fasciolopsis buskii]|uniref:Uncharacterized protein n=1 Tax=Fasciolopsis buskii TaxID=27845 RepID=A0A8E0RK71_9TREM|nr:hypothetical protein FBUS_01576 [Fasciolopsis buski]